MRLIRLALAFSVAVMPLLADFSYKTETKATGGAMAGALRMAQKMSKTARSAMEGATYVKGNRVASQAGNTISVMDLDASTVTMIDHDKKQYSVLTFEEYGQYMARIAEKAQRKKDVEVRYAVNIKDGGKKEAIDGNQASLTILALTVEATGNKGESGAMEMVNDLWLAKGIDGYEEVNAIHKRLSEKLYGSMGGAFGAVGPMIQQQGGAAALQEFQQKAALLDGVPVLTVVRMAAAGNSASMMADAGKIPSEKADEGGDKPNMGSILRGMGGFGGGGRGNQNSGGGEGSGTLIEMTVRAYGFSNAPVQDSVFQVPSGYKQVDSELKKAAR